MDNTVNEIKDRIDIADLVGQYVKLKKIGRNFKGLCPFHSEKTPSFIVSPEKQIAYCFGCNKGGDIFRFIQEVEGIDFADAVKVLAERAGVKIEKAVRSEKNAGADRGDLYSIYEKTAEFFSEQLWTTEAGSQVRGYLIGRGMTEESIRFFRLGFAPDSYEATYSYLIKLGYSKKQLIAGGLVVSKETTMEKVYDRFRMRLMFPIFDHMGRIVAFGGRALGKDQEPKYLNSPESQIYHKSNILYGYNFAKPVIKEQQNVLVVEGYMDVIMSYQSGVKNVVAPCGTALVASQIRMMKPLLSDITLAFDNDLAGQEAAKRAFEIVQQFDLSAYVVSVPDGKDPADYVKNHGEDFARVFSERMLFGEYLYKKLFSAYGTDSIAAKKLIVSEFLPFFAFLRSNVEKDEYVRRLASDLGMKEVQIYDELHNVRLPDFHPARSHGSIDGGVVSVKRAAEELLLGFLIEYPRMAKMKISGISEELFSDELKPIYKSLLDQYNNHDSDSGESLIGLLPHEIKEKAGLLSLYVAERYNEMSEENVEKEIDALYGNMQKKFQSEKVRVIKNGLMEAEKEGNKGKSDLLMTELTNLYKGTS